MDSYTVNILPGGRITIPAAIRRSLDLHPGDALIWWLENRELHFRKAPPDEVVPHNEPPTTAETSSADIERTPEEE